MEWTGKGKYPPEQERERKRALLEARENERYQKRLQAIKDKKDLYGEDSLDYVEQRYVILHHDFFYPEEG